MSAPPLASVPAFPPHEPCKGGTRCWCSPTCPTVCAACKGTGSEMLLGGYTGNPCLSCGATGKAKIETGVARIVETARAAWIASWAHPDVFVPEDGAASYFKSSELFEQLAARYIQSGSAEETKGGET